jgi:hypothetical protein
MQSILSGGKLRERVKKGEVAPKDALRELLILQRQGEAISPDIIKWLGRRGVTAPRPEVEEQEAPRPKKSKKQLRRQRRKQR